MTQTVHGIVHGKTIELSEDLGVPDGEQVEVSVRRLGTGPSWGEGIRRSAGGWAAYPEMDAVMETIQHERRRERTPQVEW